MISDPDSNRPLAFLITAAGSGSRMGKGIKKEFRELNGTPVLAITLKAFLDTSLFSFGLITCRAGTEEIVKDLFSELTPQLDQLKKPLLFCSGGAERQESVMLGLNNLFENCPEIKDKGCVLIHDGARPWVSPELIKRVVNGTLKHGACAPVTPSIDAMKEINAAGIITGHLPRKETVNVQTPQGFLFNEIRTAHHKASADGRHYIDDTEIFSRYEGDVYTIEGSTKNRKITYAGDLKDSGDNIK